MQPGEVTVGEERVAEEHGRKWWVEGDAALYAKATYVFMGLLAVYVVARGLRGAAVRLFWYEELQTLMTAGQASWEGMWTVIRRGFDLQQPTFYLIERLALSVPVKKEVALRLPSILAMPVTFVCVFAYARRRSGGLLACLCAFLLLSTSLVHTYLIEARPYSMVIACIAVAMVCYQRTSEGGEPRVGRWKWTLGLAVSLLAAGALHYYAVLAMVPFGIAELTVLVTKRRVRWLVWVALALPLAASLRLLITSKSFYAAHNYALPDWAALGGYYGTFLLLKDDALGVAVALGAMVGIAWSRFQAGGGREEGGAREKRDYAEGMLLLSMVALPVIAYVLARLAHGTLVSPYVMATTLGLALGITAVLGIAGRKAAAVFALFVVFLVGWRQATFWRHPDFDPYLPYHSATSMGQIRDIENLVGKAGHGELPVVVSDRLLQAQLAWYGRTGWKERWVYLTDEKRDLQYLGPDTSSKTAMTASEFFPLRVEGFDAFTAAHPEFLLYYDDLGWYLKAFVNEGYAVELLPESGGQLYLVRTKEGTGR